MSEKKLTRDEYLRVLALFTMARSHYVKCESFECGLLESLGYKDAQPGNGGHISDALYGARRSFNEALALEGFTLPEDVL